MNQELTGKFIAQLRKEKNLTQKELAYKLGISDKTVSKWEIARNKHSELRIQGRDGKFRTCNSYGNDPCPPKDKDL